MIVEHHHPGIEGVFVHPVSDPAVIAGNGTIGLEILEDLPDVDAVVVPYGGGGLLVRHRLGDPRALARRQDLRLRGRNRRAARRVARGGRAASRSTTPRASSTASAATGVLDEMWPLASRLLDGSLVVSLAEIAAAVRLLVERNRVVAEGAGAASVAAALAGKAGRREGRLRRLRRQHRRREARGDPQRTAPVTATDRSSRFAA